VVVGLKILLVFNPLKNLRLELTEGLDCGRFIAVFGRRERGG
jgi:hypothetical protein